MPIVRRWCRSSARPQIEVKETLDFRETRRDTRAQFPTALKAVPPGKHLVTKAERGSETDQPMARASNGASVTVTQTGIRVVNIFLRSRGYHQAVGQTVMPCRPQRRPAATTRLLSGLLVRSGVPTPRLLRIASGTDLGSRERRALRNVANRRRLARLAKRHDPRPSCVDRRAACVHDVIADPVVACAPFSGVAGTRLCYGRTIGSRDPRLQVAADRCGLLIVSPCDSIARSDELRLEM
jgi:hypothetical protein